MDLLALGFVTGAVVAWIVKDGSLWALAEECRYWHDTCAGAEAMLRLEQARRGLTGVPPRVRSTVRRAAGAGRSWTVRVLVPSIGRRRGKTWRPAPFTWPGWRTTTP